MLFWTNTIYAKMDAPGVYAHDVVLLLTSIIF